MKFRKPARKAPARKKAPAKPSARAKAPARRKVGSTRKPAPRRNPGLEGAALSDFKPKDAAEAKAVKKLAGVYKDYHWGAPAGKVFRINDSLIPHLTAMGKLNQLNVGGVGMIDFPEGCWVAWDPKHPRKRLYLVIPPAVREKFRNAIKHAEKVEPIQAIANRAGGEQARYKLPAVKGVEIGPIEEIVYTTWKKGDDDDKGGCGYIHEFGGDGLSGYLPVLAVDVSGRLWVCGGSYHTAAAGVTG